MVWVHGGGLEHERRRPVDQGAVHDVRVSRDPAHVRHAGKDVSFLQAKGSLRRHARVEHVPRRRVRHALRGSRRPRGV